MFQPFAETAGGTTNLAEPSKEGLIYLLRHKELWPAGFAWNFMNPCSCAMGLAVTVWPEQVRWFMKTGEAIGISGADASRIFGAGRGCKSTAEDIAQLLEQV